MFKALMTAIYQIDPARMQEARDWYELACGKKPYFNEPQFYVGFNIAGYELGLHPKSETECTEQMTGCCAYWGVDNIVERYNALLELGAQCYSAPQDVGGGIWVAQVRDPFGNLFGLIHNPHFPNQEGL